MDRNKISDLITLAAISKKIGSNLNLVQGAGGNTSLKNDGILWVKASGCRLKDAENRDIFVPVDHLEVVKRLMNDKNESLEFSILQMDEVVGLRPSIETSLHALMPHRYVVHVHSVNALGNAVLLDGEKKMTQLLSGVNWSWVSYVRPGIPLTRAIQRVMRPGLNVIVLANHGLVLGAESEDEIMSLLNDLEGRLYRKRRDSIMVDDNEIQLLVKNTDYIPTQYSIVHSLAFDSVALSIMANRPLYPDHIVFLGAGPMPIMTIEDVKCYLKQKKRPLNHKIIIVKDVGVIKYHSLSESAEEMMYCLANVLLRIQPGEKLRYLNKCEEAEIEEWDAEKFRQVIQS